MTARAPKGSTCSSTLKSRSGHDVDAKLMQLLVCPITKGSLHYDRETGELWSKGARLAYPIRSGVPIMLPEEARSLSDDEMTKLIA